MTTTNHTSPSCDELLPCPFCGSAAEMKHSYQWWIQCTNEACGAVQNEAQMDPKGAADAWNRRAVDKSTAANGAMGEREAFTAWYYSPNRKTGDELSSTNYCGEFDEAISEHGFYAGIRYARAALTAEKVVPTPQQISDYLRGLDEIQRAVSEREGRALTAEKAAGMAVLSAAQRSEIAERVHSQCERLKPHATFRSAASQAISDTLAALTPKKVAAEPDTTDGNCGKCWPHKCSCHTSADTGNAEADQILGRLMSSDPDFEDCVSAAAFIRKLVVEHKGPDGFATWKDAAIAERIKRVRATQPEPAPYADNRGSRSPGDVMMSAYAFCPDSVAGQPARMRWIADYFLKNYAAPQPAQPAQAATLSDAAIQACIFMICGICMTQPREAWGDAIEKRIRHMLAAHNGGKHD